MWCFKMNWTYSKAFLSFLKKYFWFLTYWFQKRFLFISMVSMSILVFHQSNVELLSQKENFKGAKIRTVMKYILYIEQHLQMTWYSISENFLIRLYKTAPCQKLSWPTPPPVAEKWDDPPFCKARNLLTHPPFSSGSPPSLLFDQPLSILRLSRYGHVLSATFTCSWNLCLVRGICDGLVQIEN